MRKNYGKLNRLIIPTLFFAFNVCLVLFPSEVLESAREGLLLWFNRVLPALLPFATGVCVLTRLGVTEAIGSLLSPVTEIFFNLPGAAGTAVLTGFTSGYPMGAMAANELYKNKLLDEEETQRLAGFCNNAGPLFIVGFAGAAMFGDAEIGYKLLAAHIISALLLGVVSGIKSKRERRFKFNKRDILNKEKLQLNRGDKLGKILGESAEKVMVSMTTVGALIIFFSVITGLLNKFGIVNGAAGGLLEITNGVKFLAAAENMNLNLRLTLTAGIISFGGLSVHAQALNFLSDTKINAGHYLLCKAVHGISAAVVMMLLI